ncbi:unnamed protein product [Amaranthus hypochondriacus]
MITIHHPWVFAFGLLGNIISFMVFLAPLPTFIRVYKKKSTEGFQSVPYVVAIFSAMLWIYYALLKGNSMLLITINVAGVIIETIYIVIYLTYAPIQARISTLKLLIAMNICGFCSIVLFCHYLIKADARVQVFGWICVAFSITVFAAPLSVMRTVIQTKSVEYMPINLSLCLTLTATIWFLYGFVQKDLYITLPNVVGFMFGVAQMVLYAIYRKYDKAAQKQNLPEIVSPVKQNQNVDTIIPQPHQEEKKEIEVVIATNNNLDHDMGHDANLYGPPQGPLRCDVDAENIVGGPTGPTSVQLVQCEV